MFLSLPVWVLEPCLAARKSSGQAVTPIADKEDLCKRLENFARGNHLKGDPDYDAACLHGQARQAPHDFEQLLLALQLWPEEPQEKEVGPDRPGRGRAPLPRRRPLTYDEKRIYEPLCKFNKSESQPDLELVFANSATEFYRLYLLGKSWVTMRYHFGASNKQKEDLLVRRKLIWYLRTVNNVLMRHRELQTHQARLNFKRLLTAIAKECPELGFEPSMLVFAAAILDLFGHQRIRHSWYVFMRAYKTLRLSEYFADAENPTGKKTPLRKDAEKVWEMLQNTFPMVSASFKKLGCQRYFFEVAEDLLSSVLMSGYNENVSGSLECYFRLAEALLYAEAPACDPREQLRNAVFSIFVRRWKRFEAAQTRDDLRKLVKSFEDGVRIDDATLQIFEAKLCSPWSLPSTLATMPLFAAGCGSYIANLFLSATNSLGPEAAHFCALPVGAACAVGTSCALMFGDKFQSMVSIEEARELAAVSV